MKKLTKLFLALSFALSVTSPLKVLFSPINSATNEFTGFSYSSAGFDNCWTFPSLKTAILLDIVKASLWSWVT